MAFPYDILLDSNGDLPKITRHVRGWEVVVQRVQFRLQTFKGEWILDTNEGLPYLEWQALKGPNLGEIGAKIQSDLLATPGVIRLTEFEGEFLYDEQRIRFKIGLEVEDVGDETQDVDLTFFPFGQTTANTNPIALYTAGSKAIM